MSVEIEIQKQSVAQPVAKTVTKKVTVKPAPKPAKPQSATEKSAAPQPSSARVPVIRQLKEQLLKCKTRQQIWKTICQFLGTVLEAESVQVQYDDGVTSLDEGYYPDPTVADAWSRMREGLLVRSQQHNTQLARACKLPEMQLERMIFATPIPSTGADTFGAVAVVTSQSSPIALETQMREVEATLEFVNELFNKPQPVAPSSSGSVNGIDIAQADGVARSANYTSLNEFAFALANGLKGKLACDEVSLGVVENNKVRVLCISGLDDVYPRSPGTQDVQQAMEECFDYGESIRIPAEPGELTPSFALHQRWQSRTNAAGVGSVPLFHKEDCIAVMSLRSNAQDSLSEQQLEIARKLAAPLAPGLLLLRKADQSLSDHVKSSLKEKLSNGFLTGRSGKLIGAAVALTTLWMLFGWTNYELRVPCEVVAENVTEVSAPFPGRIKAAHVEPGDVVHAGQLLIEFNTQDVESELKQAHSEFDIAQTELSMAISAKDVAAAGRANNRAEGARARVNMLTERLANATIRASKAGMILDGDLKSRVGEMVQLGTPLMRMAESNSIAVELRIPEGDVSYVKQEQIGQFVVSSRPGHSFDCSVRRIDPSAQVIEGSNVFLARATPGDTEGAEWLRPGMRGLASVSTGKQPVWWVWMHKGINWFRLQAWSL